MTTLEKVVRPFQYGDVFTQANLSPIPFNPTIEIPPDVVTTWEGAGDTDFVDEGLAWYIGLETDLKEDKPRRQSKTVKVTNPDDPDSHVYVERIDKTVFTDKSGKETSLEFDWKNPKDGAV